MVLLNKQIDSWGILTWTSLEGGGEPQPFKLSINDILYISVTLCSTDTVAALTMIKSKEHPKLFSLVFGEGLVNDAVAIILFNAINRLVESKAEFDSSAALGLLANFALMSIQSILIGYVIGLLTAIMFAKCRFISHSVIHEVTMVFFCGYTSYIVAELFHLSGVISLLICGVVLGHYNWYNLSDRAKESTGLTFQAFSLAAEAFLFIYLGMSTFMYKDSQWSFSLVGLEIGCVLIARLSSVFAPSWLAMLLLRKKWKVDNFELFIVAFSGMIRGAIAFALVLTVHNSDQEKIVKTTVFGVVMISTIGLGIILPKIINTCIKLRGNPKNRSSVFDNDAITKREELLRTEDKEEVVHKAPKNAAHAWWRRVDENYLKPLLIYKYKEQKEELQAKKLQFKEGEIEHEIHLKQ
eukprot:TRINITY_DN5962_c0_g1_i1.p1 TRINITY_DN5962_c0_g1~~TRINITY_DN5962_c0_g1_i1.p1  ORF type:complete len:410 (+),score=77.55 TRINITY_DN5962_c0_g1_i1:270-1499(+)